MDPLQIVALIIALIILVVILALSIKIVNQWERVVVLYLGRFVGIRGPGLVVIIPFLNSIPYIIDTRVITTSFNAEQTLTKDTVPVDVDAVLFWQVFEVQKAALEVQNYKDAVLLAAQTALPGCHWQDHARRYAGRQGNNRCRTPENHPAED